MSLYVSQRLGRGLSIGSRTSPLALLFIIPLWLGFAALQLALKLIPLFPVVFFRAHEQHQRERRLNADRAALARSLVQDAVTVDCATVRREGLLVWAVYGIGHRFVPGRYPADKQRLARLYPSEADELAVVGLFPTAASARKVADGMRRGSYTTDELLHIFGKQRRHIQSPEQPKARISPG